VGGTDTTGPTPKPVVDVWDLRYVAAAPGTKLDPRPLASLPAPWATGHLGIDEAGSGLLYTWDETAKHPVAVPFERPQFVLSGLSRPPGAAGPHVEPITRPVTPTSLAPLGVPLEITPQAEADQREANERAVTAAFKVRIALPGS